MNKTFTPVLMGAQILGTGMKHPRVPKVYVGSELNGFVQGDLMDANAISQFISEKTHGLSDKLDQFGETNSAIESMRTEIDTILNTMRDIVEDIDSLGTVEGYAQQINVILGKIETLERMVDNTVHSTVTTNEDGDLIVNIS